MYVLDLFGVATFSITGALIAKRKRTNTLGVLISAMLTAVGGGTLRDIMLGATPVFWIHNPAYLIIIAIAAFSIFIAMPCYRLRTQVFFVADAISLAVFTIIGIQKAIAINVPLFNALLLGILTGLGGGIMRDIFLGHKLSLIFQQELYVTASLLGGCSYLLLYSNAVSSSFATFSSILIVLGIRLAANHWALRLLIWRIEKITKIPLL